MHVFRRHTPRHSARSLLFVPFAHKAHILSFTLYINSTDSISVAILQQHQKTVSTSENNHNPRKQSATKGCGTETAITPNLPRKIHTPPYKVCQLRKHPFPMTSVQRNTAHPPKRVGMISNSSPMPRNRTCHKIRHYSYIPQQSIQPLKQENTGKKLPLGVNGAS